MSTKPKFVISDEELEGLLTRYTRDITAHVPQLIGVAELLGRVLHAQAKLGLQQFQQFLLQLPWILGSEFVAFRFHN